jgi:hypothetical protein
LPRDAARPVPPGRALRAALPELRSSRISAGRRRSLALGNVVSLVSRRSGC